MCSVSAYHVYDGKMLRKQIHWLHAQRNEKSSHLKLNVAGNGFEANCSLGASDHDCSVTDKLLSFFFTCFLSRNF